MASLFDGAKGYYTATPEELHQAMMEALQHQDGPAVINVQINPTSQRKAQVTARSRHVSYQHDSNHFPLAILPAALLIPTVHFTDTAPKGLPSLDT